MISPTRFEKQIEILNMNFQCDLVTAGVCSITNDNRPVGVRFGSPNDSITGRKLLLGQCAVVHAAILGRKSWFLRNPYDISANRMEDYELWLRAYSKNDFKLYILGEPLYYYREEENVTPKRILTAYAGQRQLFKRYGRLGFNRFEIPLVVSVLHCKSFVVRILSALNKMDVLLKRRNREINDPNSMDTFVREINQILSTKVPGLD
jgi:hypothetical protein